MEPVLRISGRGSFTVTTARTSARNRRRRCSESQNIPEAGRISYPSRLLFPCPSCDISSSSCSDRDGGPDHGQRRAYCPRQRAAGRNWPGRSESLLDNHLRSDYKINCRGKYLLDLGSRTHVMGILNVTPDSFSDGGRYADPGRALAHAREMVAAGADILDIGGESTRPGAAPLSEDEELRRIIPAHRTSFDGADRTDLRGYVQIDRCEKGARCRRRHRERHQRSPVLSGHGRSSR